MDRPFDRSAEDLGNVVHLEHVNLRIPDQRLATLFYVTGLGLTRDPYLMTGTTNMWVNVGRSQFHLPTGAAQVLRGHVGLVLPDSAALLRRLAALREPLAGTAFDYAEHDGYVDAVSPWGNRVRCYAPQPRFGRLRLGIPYVAFDVPPGTAESIATFYREIIDTPAQVTEEVEGRTAHVAVGIGQSLLFRETTRDLPPFDGHHVQIYLVDFSGPYRRLLERGLVSREDDQHQYRFADIVDVGNGKVLYTMEHEVRSLRHPLYARPLVNRNPAQSNQDFTPGGENLAWAMGGSEAA